MARRRAPCAAGWIVAWVALAASGWAHSPHDVAEYVVVSPSFATDQTLIVSLHFTNNHLVGRSTDGGLTWELTVPAASLHGINALAMSPAFGSDGVVFAVTEDGGVHRSGDGGISWSAVNTGLPATPVNDVAVSPGFDADGTVAVATDLGVYLSTDRGVTWQPAGPGMVVTGTTAVRFGADAGTLWAGSTRLHLSTDGGASWTPLFDFGLPLGDLEVSAPAGAATATLVACFGRFGGGVLASTDGGVTFAPSVEGMPSPVVNDLVLAADGSLLAADKTSGCLIAPGLFTAWTWSDDGLEHLSPLTSNHYTAVAVSPDFATDGRIFLAGFEGLFASADRGLTWEQRETYTLRVNRWVELPDDFPATGRVLLGNYGGSVLAGRVPLAASPVPAPAAGPAPLAGPGGPLAAPAPGQAGGALRHLQPEPHAPGAVDVAWRTAGTGLDLFSSVLAWAPGESPGRTIFYGYTELYRSDDGGESWLILPEPDEIDVVRAIAISPAYASDRRVLVGTTAEGLWESLDAGATWQLLPGFAPTGNISRIVHSPDHGNDSTIFIATMNAGVFRSQDDGATWQPQPGSPTTVRDIAISPDFAADDTLWAGSVGNGLWVSGDRGASWSQVGGGVATADNIVEGLAVSPGFADDRTLFAASQTHGLLASTDGGATWETRGAGLTRNAVRRVALSPDFVHDRTMLLSTFDWVWLSRDAGASWKRLDALQRADNIHQSVWHIGDWFTANPGHNDGGPADGGGADMGPVPVGPSYAYGTSISSSAGDVVALRFFGERVAWYSARGPDSGIVTVEIDGEPVATVDLYAPAQAWMVEAFRRELGPADWHLVRVINTGAANRASAGIKVHDDGFAYWN